jgi:integrase/recombinase XerC
MTDLPARRRATPDYLAAPEIVLEGPQAVVRAFFEGREPTTKAAYEADIMVLVRFLRAAKVLPSAPADAGAGFDARQATAAVAWLFSQTQGKANQVTLSFRNWLAKQGLAPATINRRLAAIKSMSRIARLLGHVHWIIEVPGLKPHKIKDTRGPDLDGVRALFNVLSRRFRAAGALARTSPHRYEEAKLAAVRAVRDRAILRLFYDLALRRTEVASLDLRDVSFRQRRLRVRRKGGEVRYLTLPRGTLKALGGWIKRRGATAGPLFLPLNASSGGSDQTSRLGDKSLYRMVRKLGKDAGLTVWPHALRHAAITEALDATDGDVRSVAKFSGHKRLDTVLVYDDERRDLQGDVAEKVAGRVE